MTIYSDIQDSIAMTEWNTAHQKLILSNLTAGDQHLSHPRHQLPQASWPTPGQRVADPDPDEVKVIVGIYVSS
jgi:hypothetical protein